MQSKQFLFSIVFASILAFALGTRFFMRNSVFAPENFAKHDQKKIHNNTKLFTEINFDAPNTAKKCKIFFLIIKQKKNSLNQLL